MKQYTRTIWNVIQVIRLPSMHHLFAESRRNRWRWPRPSSLVCLSVRNYLSPWNRLVRWSEQDTKWNEFGKCFMSREKMWLSLSLIHYIALCMWIYRAFTCLSVILLKLMLILLFISLFIALSNCVVLCLSIQPEVYLFDIFSLHKQVYFVYPQCLYFICLVSNS